VWRLADKIDLLARCLHCTTFSELQQHFPYTWLVASIAQLSQNFSNPFLIPDKESSGFHCHPCFFPVTSGFFLSSSLLFLSSSLLFLSSSRAHCHPRESGGP